MPMSIDSVYLLFYYYSTVKLARAFANSYSPDAWYMSEWISFYWEMWPDSVLMFLLFCAKHNAAIENFDLINALDESALNAPMIYNFRTRISNQSIVIPGHTWTRRQPPMSFTHQNTMWTVSIELSRVPITPLYKFTAPFVVVDWLFQLNISMFCRIECIYTELLLRIEMSVLELLSRSNTNDFIFIFIHIEWVPTLFINQWIWMRWLYFHFFVRWIRNGNWRITHVHVGHRHFDGIVMDVIYSAEMKPQWKRQTRAQSTSQIRCRRFFYVSLNYMKTILSKLLIISRLHLHGYYASMDSINTTKCWMWIVNITTFLTDASSSDDLRQTLRKQKQNEKKK